MISIIINCHNGSKYLAKTIQSIIDQDYQNFEVIFWNNKSTDASKNIYFSFKEKYKNINFRYYENSQKLSLYQARNEALKKVRGDFICFLDTDDLWLKNKLNVNLEKFKKGEYDIIFSNIYILNQKKNTQNTYIKKKLNEKKIYKSLLNNFNASLVSMMIKKSVFDNKKNSFDSNFDHIGDFDFILRMSKKYKFGYIEKPLAIYRLHDNNLTKKNRLNEIEELETWVENNNLKLNKKEIMPINNKLLERKFIYFKLLGEFKKSLIIYSKINLKLKLKLFILIFLPKKVLEKILSF